MTTEMEEIKVDSALESNPKSEIRDRRSERGMSLLAVIAVMTLFAIALLAVAPSVQQEIQREKELESIRRGEEVARAIEEYIIFHRGAKLPNSIDDLLEGLPQGTKKRQILRASAAVDPLSEDGKWQLVPIDKMKSFARRVQTYNNGLLPSSNNSLQQIHNRLGAILTNVEKQTDEDPTAPADETDIESFSTENNPFIGVVSQSKSRSIIAYYGVENHSKWIFTPLFRGLGTYGYRNNRERIPTNTSGNSNRRP